MPRIRKAIPGVDPKLLIKDAAKLMPDPARRLFLRGAASLGALTFLTGCDIIDGAVGRRRAAQDFRIQRRRAGLAVQSQQAGADLSRKRDHPAVSVQRLLSRGRSAGGRRRDLQARGRRPGRQQEAVDAGASSMRCRRCRRSPATSASRAGARSAPGRACGCREFLKRSAPTRARNMSGSSAPRAIPTPSTWRPRCIRRRR